MNLEFKTAVRHALPSILLSADDDPGRPTDEMIRLALQAVQAALGINLSSAGARMSGPPLYPEVWPGEHYRLLAGLVEVLKPRIIIEIGTATGLSALALKHKLRADGLIVTFDLVPWAVYPDGVLVSADFADNRLKQIVGDLTDFTIASQFQDLLRAADLIFVDAAKDGAMEVQLLRNFTKLGLKEGAWLLFDDIRMLTMISIWREISMPKLDLTSFGHWSGTGLVQWRGAQSASGSAGG